MPFQSADEKLVFFKIYLLKRNQLAAFIFKKQQGSNKEQEHLPWNKHISLETLEEWKINQSSWIFIFIFLLIILHAAAAGCFSDECFCTTTISFPYPLVRLPFQARKKIQTYFTVDPLMLYIFATFQTRFSPLKRPYTNLTSKQKRWVRICSFQNTPRNLKSDKNWRYEDVFTHSHLAGNASIYPFYLAFSRSFYLHSLPWRIPVLLCLPILNFLQLSSPANHCTLILVPISGGDIQLICDAYHTVNFIWNII